VAPVGARKCVCVTHPLGGLNLSWWCLPHMHEVFGGGYDSFSSAAPGGLGAPAEGDLQQDVSGTIETQVARLIDQARHVTESKVKIELKQIVQAMQGMDKHLDQLLSQLDGVDAPSTAEPPLDAEAVGALLSKIEQQWGQEIRTLKQELHQTILAHNHNADLIKHHKDTIDALRERCTKLQSSSVKTGEIQQQLLRLDARLKQQQKQRKLEPLFERLAALEHKIGAAAQTTYSRGFGAMPPVGLLPPGMGAHGMGLPGKGANQKGGGMGQERQKPSNDKAAAYMCPSDEEVQARLSQLEQVAVDAEAGVDPGQS